MKIRNKIIILTVIPFFALMAINAYVVTDRTAKIYKVEYQKQLLGIAKAKKLAFNQFLFLG
jgi:hypothetical protein